MKNIDDYDFGKVAVLLGGRSAEREVSLNSGKSILQALLNKGIDAHSIDVGDDIVDRLIEAKVDRAFIILHGREGEDGVIQGLLEMMDIPYTGSGVGGSALAMDKVKSKLIWQRMNLPTLPFLALDTADINLVKENFKMPICVKPVHEGSSNGVSKVSAVEQFQAAYEHALQYHDQIMIEEWIEGREFTVGILHDKALPVVEICVPYGFYSYEAKYGDVETQYHCPCDLSDDKQLFLQQLALQAFDLLGCSGWGRVDFLQNKRGDFWLTEANTIPGMTNRSLVPKAAKELGLDFDDLILQILATSLRNL